MAVPKDLVRANGGIVAPQYLKDDESAFEPLKGSNGAINVNINGSLAKGPDGNDFIIEGTNCKGRATSKPIASSYPFYTYWSVDTDPHALAVEVSDGTNWVVI